MARGVLVTILTRFMYSKMLYRRVLSGDVEGKNMPDSFRGGYVVCMDVVIYSIGFMGCDREGGMVRTFE
jgi:hypothetical protein